MRKHKLSNHDGKVELSMAVSILLLLLIVLFALSRDFRQFCLGFATGRETSQRLAAEQAVPPSLPKSPATPGTPSAEDKTNAVHRALRDQATAKGLEVFNESWLQTGDIWFTHGKDSTTARNYYKQEKGVDYDLVERNVSDAEKLNGSTFEGILYFHSQAERICDLPSTGCTAWASPTGAIFAVKIQGRQDGWIAYTDESAGEFAGGSNDKLSKPNPEPLSSPTPPGVAVGQLSPEDFVKRGNVKYARRDLDGAIADYSKAIELNPKDSDAYMNRGYVERAKGDQAGADEDFAQATKLQGP